MAMPALHAEPLSAAAVRACLPRPGQLAGLGAVLCLYPAGPGGDLAGWPRAARAQAHSRMDSEGLRESLHFFDAQGLCCWRLYLLPDSDFLAWEELVSGLPRDASATTTTGGLADRLWRRLAHGLSARAWQASVLRFRAPGAGPAASASAGALEASLATVSALSAAVAARIAHEEGAGNAAFVDECCCARAARLVRRTRMRS